MEHINSIYEEAMKKEIRQSHISSPLSPLSLLSNSDVISLHQIAVHKSAQPTNFPELVVLKYTSISRHHF